MNGVVWRGDPDHCDILPERKEASPKMKTFGADAAIADTILRPAVVAMAGSMLLVSDKAEVYQDDAHLEGMKRSAAGALHRAGPALQRRRQRHLVAAGDRPALRPLVGAGAVRLGRRRARRSRK